METKFCNNVNVLDIFEEKSLVKICAPMVRYSKLQFRTLVRNYNCDLCFTPMILADSFCQSAKARNNEFTTNLYDTPVIAQFAAKTVDDFVGAARLISPHSSGVDLNCGCPQTWAKQMGVGCTMLKAPELVYDLVRQCRNQILKPFTVSVKMRILKDLKETVEICRQLERCGASFLTIHARTSSQLTGNINEEALKLVAENVSCPVVANGGIRDIGGCSRIQEETKCRGVMVANGLLTNPTLFSGSQETTSDCIQRWLDICFNSTLSQESYNRINTMPGPPVNTIPEKPPNLTFQCFHHHLVFMLEKVLPKAKRRIFNNLQKFGDVLKFLEDELGMGPQLYAMDAFGSNRVLEVRYENGQCFETCHDNKSYSYESNEGKYFQSKVNCWEQSDDECGIANIFEENE